MIMLLYTTTKRYIIEDEIVEMLRFKIFSRNERFEEEYSLRSINEKGVIDSETCSYNEENIPEALKNLFRLKKNERMGSKIICTDVKQNLELV